ncbi:FmdB family zinc ribbon protein [Nocardioides sp. GXQ0305]|uniref:FmdB family zinc ribbon protein n=1 Tax=Nocardioides sp. GXQ0305 TaxID=3423912 RepID=UPI003D7E73A1
MPTYQYACTECGHAFEQFQSFSDDALTECPECRGRLRKLFNAVGVVFKGSGFYRTDSRATNGASAGSEGSAGSSGGESSSGSGSGSGSKEAASTTSSTTDSSKSTAATGS